MEKLTVPGTHQALDDVTGFVLRVAGRAQLDERDTYRLRLAVDEIATNIVTHGYCCEERRGELSLAAEWDEKRLVVRLEDDGESYDPRQAEPPADLGWPAESRGPGGLGVYLALCYVDGFDYEQVESRNRTTFIIRRSPSRRVERRMRVREEQQVSGD